MSLRTSINWLITLVMLLFIVTLAALQISAARRSTAAEMEAATRVTVQLLVSLIGNENARQGTATPEAVARMLEQAGRIRAHDIEVLDAQRNVLHHSPPSPWKVGRYAPAWFAALVAPQGNVIVLPVGNGSLRIVPEDSRMVLDAWDELLNLFWLSLLLFTLLNLLVFWFAGRTVRENHSWMQLIQRHIEDERRNLAHELHDEIGQSLTAVKTLATTLVNRTRDKQPELQSTAQTIVEVSTQMYDDMHGLVRQLRPLVLDKLGLQAALQELVAAQQARHAELRFTLAFSGDVAGVGQELAITAYRMVQESLTNVVRHAAASDASINVDVTDHKLTVSVADNGQGVRTNPDDYSERYGLIGMRERAEALGGSFHWQDDNGVCVVVSLPLKVAGAKS